MPFVVHALGDHQYGIWVLVGAFTSYYSVLDLGLSSAVSRYLAKALGSGDHDECNRVFNTALCVFLGLAALILLVSCITAALAPTFCKTPDDASLFSRVILILGASVAAAFPAKVFQGALEAHLRYDRTNFLNLLGLVFRTALVVVFILAGSRVVGLAWATLLASIPTILLQIYFALKDLPFLQINFHYWHRSTATSLFSYSAISFIIHIAVILRFQVDNVIVASFVGVAAVTHYVIASRLAEYFMELVSTSLGALRSVFSRQEGAQDYETLRWTFFFGTKISVFLCTFVAFGLIAWGAPFIERWMGASYLDAYPCLVALVLGLTFALWQSPAVSLFFALSKHSFLAIWTTLEAVANLLLSVLLARRFGIFGVALGTMIPMMLFKLLVQPIYVCRLIEVQYSEYITKMALSVGAAFLSLIIPLVLTLTLATADYGILLALGLLSLITYIIPLWLLAFTRREITLIQQAIWPMAKIRDDNSPEPPHLGP